MRQHLLFKILWLWLIGCVGLSSLELDTEFYHNTFDDVYDYFVPVQPEAMHAQAQQHWSVNIGQAPAKWTLSQSTPSLFSVGITTAPVFFITTSLFLRYRQIRI